MRDTTVLENWRSMNAAGMRIRMEHIRGKAKWEFREGNFITARALWRQYKAAERRLAVLIRRGTRHKLSVHGRNHLNNQQEK